MKRLLIIAAVSGLLAACKDPVLVERAESLGPDTGNYEEGPYHRAGFPCTYCHAKGSTTGPVFDLAGTVYERRDSSEGLPGALVRLFDQSGKQLVLESNQAGNFFIIEGELALDFPIWVRVEHGGEVTAMQTPIFRERSCAACHTDPPGPASAGRVYVKEEP